MMIVAARASASATRKLQIQNRFKQIDATMEQDYGDPAEHAPCGDSGCGQCFLRDNLPDWRRRYADKSLVRPADSERIVWAQDAPRSWKQTKWSMGCSLCCERMKKTDWAGTKWSRFQVVPAQACDLAQHAQSTAHRKSLADYFDVPVTKLHVAPAADTSLRRRGRPQGRAVLLEKFPRGCPQPHDYIAVWHSNLKNHSALSLKQQKEVQSLMEGSSTKYSIADVNKMRWTMCEALKSGWRDRLSGDVFDVALLGDGKQFVGEALLFTAVDFRTLGTVRRRSPTVPIRPRTTKPL